MQSSVISLWGQQYHSMPGHLLATVSGIGTIPCRVHMDVFTSSYPRDNYHLKPRFTLTIISQHTSLHPFMSAATQSVQWCCP